jgi:hypothetical protein
MKGEELEHTWDRLKSIVPAADNDDNDEPPTIAKVANFDDPHIST